MKENFDASAGSRPKRDDSQSDAFGLKSTPGQNGSRVRAHANGHSATPAFDSWTFLDLLLHRWAWLASGALLCAGAFLLLASHLIKQKFTASAQLLRYENPVV